MCELFAISAAQPTGAQLSLNTFFQRGGQTGPHKDGWGFGCYQQADAWLFRDAHSAAASLWAPLVQLSAPESTLMMAHIRLATHGDVQLANTQPFSSLSQGKRWLFSHNGHVPRYQPESSQLAFEPLGSTDSEQVFAATLHKLAALQSLPEAEQFQQLEQFLVAIAQHGPLNLLFSNGDTLFAFSNKRTQADKSLSAPGMHLLKRHCQAGANNDTAVAYAQQSVVLFASVPLSQESWQPMLADRLYVAREGRLIHAPNLS